jgi:hypothetical protein
MKYLSFRNIWYLLRFIIFYLVGCPMYFECTLFRNVFLITFQGPSWPWSYGSWIYNYLCNRCLSPLMLWVRISIRSRCTTLCDKVCQWLATGRWFSPGSPISSTYKTDRHDITVIMLQVALNSTKQNNLITFLSNMYLVPYSNLFELFILVSFCILRVAP